MMIIMIIMIIIIKRIIMVMTVLIEWDADSKDQDLIAIN